MPRRRSPEKRKILPDPKYKDIIVAKFMNHIMRDGKKSVAEKIVYGAFDKIDQAAKSDPVELFKKALDAIGPMVEVKSRRVGGSNYQVPVEVNPRRRLSLAMRWILDAALKRNDKAMKNKLASELLDACEGKGSAVKKREDVHKMAEANKAFAHYRW